MPGMSVIKIKAALKKAGVPPEAIQACAGKPDLEALAAAHQVQLGDAPPPPKPEELAPVPAKDDAGSDQLELKASGSLAGAGCIKLVIPKASKRYTDCIPDQPKPMPLFGLLDQRTDELSGAEIKTFACGSMEQRDPDGNVHYGYPEGAEHGIRQHSVLVDGSHCAVFWDGRRAQRAATGDLMCAWPNGRTMQRSAGGVETEVHPTGRQITRHPDGVYLETMPEALGVEFNPFGHPGLPKIVKIQKNPHTMIMHYVAADGTDIQIAPDQSMIMTLPDGSKQRSDECASGTVSGLTSLEEFERLKVAFQKFDVSGDGALSARELAKALRTLGIAVDKQTLHTVFESIDTDGSGEVDFPEFMVVARSLNSPAEPSNCSTACDNQVCSPVSCPGDTEALLRGSSGF